MLWHEGLLPASAVMLPTWSRKPRVCHHQRLERAQKPSWGASAMAGLRLLSGPAQPADPAAELAATLDAGLLRELTPLAALSPKAFARQATDANLVGVRPSRSPARACCVSDHGVNWVRVAFLTIACQSLLFVRPQCHPDEDTILALACLLFVSSSIWLFFGCQCGVRGCMCPNRLISPPVLRLISTTKACWKGMPLQCYHCMCPPEPVHDSRIWRAGGRGAVHHGARRAGGGAAAAAAAGAGADALPAPHARRALRAVLRARPQRRRPVRASSPALRLHCGAAGTLRCCYGADASVLPAPHAPELYHLHCMFHPAENSGCVPVPGFRGSTVPQL